MNTRSLITGIALMLAAVLGLGAYLLHVRRRAVSEVPAAAFSHPVAPPVSGPTEQVTLYIAYDDAGELLPQSYSVPLPQDLQERAQEIMRVLLNHYLDKNSPHPIPPGSEVRDVYLIQPGLAVIDLNAEFANGHRSGILVEELTVASLVETLAANVPGITRVKILVDGQERDSLAGHADLSSTYDVANVGRMVNALEASP
jgi:hypothetical protein